MKFLADEGVAFSVVVALRETGFDVLSILKNNRQMPDDKILNLANDTGRIVIT
ncbi:MAG: DUF5615 family PIN-like protein [Flavobacteriales bacterium]|nr:DUF5615 family PIN-like protein [Flavobacteriales bacterium]